MSPLPLFDPDERMWDEAGRATLCDFLHMVANTPLKIKILSVFLFDPYLCISTENLAQRVAESAFAVQCQVRELCDAGTFHYCESFGYSDLCSLSFQRHSCTIQHCLCLLRLALRLEPQFVWAQVDASDPRPSDTPPIS